MNISYAKEKGYIIAFHMPLSDESHGSPSTHLVRHDQKQ